MEGHVENRNIDDGRNPVRLFMFDLHLQLIILGQQLSPCAVEEGGKDTGGTTMEMEEKKMQPILQPRLMLLEQQRWRSHLSRSRHWRWRRLLRSPQSIGVKHSVIVLMRWLTLHWPTLRNILTCRLSRKHLLILDSIDRDDCSRSIYGVFRSEHMQIHSSFQ